MSQDVVGNGVDAFFCQLLVVVVSLALTTMQIDDERVFTIAVSIAYRFAVG